MEVEFEGYELERGGMVRMFLRGQDLGVGIGMWGEGGRAYFCVCDCEEAEEEAEQEGGG